MFENALSMTSSAGGLVSKLTTIVNIADTGTAMSITSMNGHGAAGRIVSTPSMNLHNPSPTAVFLNTNINQNRLTNVPESIPAIAPSLVIPFQYSAPKNTGRNAAAQISKNRLVPSATTLPGSMNAMTSAKIIAIRIPTLEMLT